MVAETAPRFDLLVGGFPCQPFSVMGKILAFRDERTRPFFSMLGLLKAVKPRHIIIENVASMRKDKRKIVRTLLENALGRRVFEKGINSNLLSAQTRNRIYWTTFPVTTPKHTGETVSDILLPLEAVIGEVTFALRESGNTPERWPAGIEPRPCHSRILKQTAMAHGKTVPLTTNSHLAAYCSPNFLCPESNLYRTLHPIERERLQKFPDNWTVAAGLPSKRGALLGNAVTTTVIKHIFNCLPRD